MIRLTCMILALLCGQAAAQDGGGWTGRGLFVFEGELLDFRSGRIADCSNDAYYCLAGRDHRLVLPRTCGSYRPGDTWSHAGVETRVVAREDTPSGPVYFLMEPGQDARLYRYEPERGVTGQYIDRGMFTPSSIAPRRTADLPALAESGRLHDSAMRAYPRQADSGLDAYRPMIGFEPMGPCGDAGAVMPELDAAAGGWSDRGLFAFSASVLDFQAGRMRFAGEVYPLEDCSDAAFYCARSPVFTLALPRDCAALSAEGWRLGDIEVAVEGWGEATLTPHGSTPRTALVSPRGLRNLVVFYSPAEGVEDLSLDATGAFDLARQARMGVKEYNEWRWATFDQARQNETIQSHIGPEPMGRCEGDVPPAFLSPR